MKFVVLSNNNSLYGKKMVQQLEKAGIPVEALVLLDQPLKYHIQLFKYVKRRVGLIQALVFSVKAVLAKDAEQIDYSEFSTPIIKSTGTNTPETEKCLQELAPDVLILAQTGIVRKNILGIPKVGTLNSHPGVLPFYRGIDCNRWAILNDDYQYIGSSVHWVDPGVDTGRIIQTEEYKIRSGEDIQQLDWNLYLQCIESLKQVLIRMQNGELPKGELQKKESGKQYYKMPLGLEKKVRKKMLAGDF